MAEAQKKEETPASDDMGATPVSKLTVKTMGLNGKKGAVLEKQGEIVWLGHIYGRAAATKIKKRTDDNGNLVEDHPISGAFEGVNLETGEVFQGGILYLPGGFHDQLEAVLREADGAVVEFAMQVGSQRDSNKAGFTWVAKNLRKPSGVDQLADLRAAVQAAPGAAKPKQLTGPAATAKK